MPTYVYTAEAKGGRDGQVWSGSRTLDLPTKLAGASKEGVTPEELVAAAWASCFGTTLIFAARELDLDLSEAAVRARITYEVDHEEGRYELTRAELEALLPPGEHPRAEEALRVAHGRCPISRVLLQGIPDVEVSLAAETAAGATAG
jgi:osmotically inducible protein OsmC